MIQQFRNFFPLRTNGTHMYHDITFIEKAISEIFYQIYAEGNKFNTKQLNFSKKSAQQPYGP